MDYQEYRVLYNRLRTYRDIERLIGEGYDERLIRTLFMQKTTRDVKKRYYIVQNSSGRMLKEWKNGRTLLEIAEKWEFPPVLTARIILQANGASKPATQRYVRNPDLLGPETAAQMREAIECDPVYSPRGNQEQTERGRWGEGLLQKWLNGQGIKYRTESDLRGQYEKTPDALLDEPMLFEGKKVCWIESKASFGDNTDFKYNSRKQLIPYTKLFGPGVVVYWVGKLDDLQCPEGVYVEDIGILEKALEPLDDVPE